MSFHTGESASLLVDQFNLNRFLKQVVPTTERDLHDSTNFDSQGSREFTPGLRKGRISAEGFWNSEAVIGSDAVLAAALNSSSVVNVTAAPAGMAIGARVYLAAADAAAYEITSPVDELTTIMIELQSTGGNLPGVSLFDVRTATDAPIAGVGQTAVDNGAGTGAGAVAHLHAPTFAGLGASLAVKIQHSTNGSTWADLLTFSTLPSVGSQRVEVAGTVHRFTRALVTVTGSGLTLRFGVALARR
jgi:hypothetical protein